MNQANGYWSSPDHYWGNQMAQKIEIFNDPFQRKLRLKYEIQPFGNVKNFLIVKVPVYELTFQCGRKNIKYFSVPIAKMLLLSILAKFLRGHLLAPPGDPGSNPAGGEIFFHFFQLKNDQKTYKICRKSRPSRVFFSLRLSSHAYLELQSNCFIRRSRNFF